MPETAESQRKRKLRRWRTSELQKLAADYKRKLQDIENELARRVQVGNHGD